MFFSIFSSPCNVSRFLFSSTQLLILYFHWLFFYPQSFFVQGAFLIFLLQSTHQVATVTFLSEWNFSLDYIEVTHNFRVFCFASLESVQVCTNLHNWFTVACFNAHRISKSLNSTEINFHYFSTSHTICKIDFLFVTNFKNPQKAIHSSALSFFVHSSRESRVNCQRLFGAKGEHSAFHFHKHFSAFRHRNRKKHTRRDFLCSILRLGSFEEYMNKLSTRARRSCSLILYVFFNSRWSLMLSAAKPLVTHG